MSGLVNDKTVHVQGPLTQYSLNSSIPSATLRPAGRYICVECGDAQITFHTPQDEYKTKCPKCGSLMQLVPKPLSVG